jgi:putative membrane protein insertion efficiency factor
MISGLLLVLVRTLLRAYRLVLSPWLPRACRFHPSCSAYAEEALARHGWKGVHLAVKRVLRCHPWNAGGVDPVP